jgi:Putative 2OG-Fe(II) oxygenase
VHDGTLLVFASWLEHSVDANTGERERISVSFNVMFASLSDRLAKPLWVPSGEADGHK